VGGEDDAFEQTAALYVWATTKDLPEKDSGEMKRLDTP
jgi:hypothetical protein